MPTSLEDLSKLGELRVVLRTVLTFQNIQPYGEFRIAGLYDLLLTITPSPIVALNRTVAVCGPRTTLRVAQAFTSPFPSRATAMNDTRSPNAHRERY